MSDWKNDEKMIYYPTNKPTLIDIPAYLYLAIDGKGNPNGEIFSQLVSALFSLAYGIKMQRKKELGIDDKVYPLEGIWSLDDLGVEKRDSGCFAKDHLIYTIMIRIPKDITNEYLTAIKKAKNSKDNGYFKDVYLKTYQDGLSVQILHKGSFDDEPESFAKMNSFLADNNYVRRESFHREIYLNDSRKTAEESRKTTLRYFIKQS